MKSGAGRGATGRMEQEKRQKMLAEYCKTRDVGLRNELVTEYMYLADMVARKYAGRGVEYDDLKQIAAMALIGALERFSCDKGIQFSTFAVPSMTGVVTKPFAFEGRRRMQQAEMGIENLRTKVDSLVIIPNDRLKFVTEQKITLANAFEVADDVLQQAVQSISDLIKNTGFINLDFADVSAVMKDAGMAHMGVGRASGKNKAEEAARRAVSSPLLETSINGARGVLVNVTGSTDVGLEEVETAANLVQEAADPNALIIFGATFDESLEDEICVTVIATGFDEKIMNAKSTDNAAPKGGRASGRNADEGGKGSDEDDPYKEIFKIFNRER